MVQAGTNITYLNGIVKSIEEVLVGDLILACDGDDYPVLTCTASSYTGTLIEISPNLWVTPDTLVLTPRLWVPANQLRNVDFINKLYYNPTFNRVTAYEFQAILIPDLSFSTTPFQITTKQVTNQTVYDLTTETTNSFVANGIILHG